MEAGKICQDYQETIPNDPEQGKPQKTASKARSSPLAKLGDVHTVTNQGGGACILTKGLKKLAILQIKQVKVKVTQLCPTLCDPMDCIVHGILQARILEWVAFLFSRGSSQSRD